MRFQFLLIAWITCIAMSYAPVSQAEAAKQAAKSTGKQGVVPQDLVVCTGWHALCSGSTDCQINRDDDKMADCDCWRVNEPHIVMTGEIQDPAVKRQTEVKCTNKHPCEIDEAPVCKAIKTGQYAVNKVKYDWVSTFSYRGWCGLYKPKACNPSEPGYIGDRSWTICDAAPCTETEYPSDPDRPLRCQCRVVVGEAFVGTKDSCTGDNGGIISAMSITVWDFENNTWTSYVPGYEYVQGACAPLKSDPLPPR